MGLFSKETVELKVTGMTCGNCVKHVTEALAGVAGVKKAEVDLDAQKATVTMKQGTDPTALMAAVKEAGYAAEPA